MGRVKQRRQETGQTHLHSAVLSRIVKGADLSMLGHNCLAFLRFNKAGNGDEQDPKRESDTLTYLHSWPPSSSVDCLQERIRTN